MFVEGYYTYENFMDAATWSLQAVEAALRVRLEAGRYLRNSQIHATNLPAFPPVMAAQMIATSHKLVAEIFGQ
jgi:hypothetical protein